MATTTVIENCTETCPRCGHVANVLDGTYVYENGSQKLLSGPQFTLDILKKLKSLTERAQKENYTKEKFINEAKEISPLLASIEKYIPSEKVSAFFAFLLALIIWLTSGKEKSEPVIQNFDYSSHNTVVGDTSKKKGSNYTQPKKKRKRR
jgi:hypothetical protein